MNDSSKHEARLSDVQFGVIVAAVGCPVAMLGVFLEIPALMVLGIMLAPIAFAFRGQSRGD